MREIRGAIPLQDDVVILRLYPINARYGQVTLTFSWANSPFRLGTVSLFVPP